MMEFIRWVILIKVMLQVVKKLKEILIIEKIVTTEKIAKKIHVSDKINSVVI